MQIDIDMLNFSNPFYFLPIAERLYPDSVFIFIRSGAGNSILSYRRYKSVGDVRMSHSSAVHDHALLKAGAAWSLAFRAVILDCVGSPADIILPPYISRFHSP